MEARKVDIGFKDMRSGKDVVSITTRVNMLDTLHHSLVQRMSVALLAESPFAAAIFAEDFVVHAELKKLKACIVFEKTLDDAITQKLRDARSSRPELTVLNRQKHCTDGEMVSHFGLFALSKQQHDDAMYCSVTSTLR